MATLVAGSVSSLIGGWLTQHYLPGLTVPLITSVLGGVAAYGALNSQLFGSSIAFLWCQYFFGEGWYAGALSSLQQVAPAEERGAAIGVFYAFCALGGSTDVFVLGLTIDDDESRSQLEGQLSIFEAGMYFVTAAIFAAAAAATAFDLEKGRAGQSVAGGSVGN